MNLENFVIDRVLASMKTHLRELKIQLLEYFPDDNDDFSKRWILIPFDENIVSFAKLPVEIHNQLIEISTGKTLQLEFLSQDLDKFSLARRFEYGSLVTEALKTLIPFVTLYLCGKRLLVYGGFKN